MSLTVARLVSFFSAELGRSVDAPGPRTQLTELLRIRPPAPIPDPIATLLHDLFAAEAAARPVVQLDDLPVLSGGRFGFGLLGEIRLWEGDITMLRADAIVNSATENLQGCRVPWHRCLDHDVHRHAGPGLRAECALVMRSASAPRRSGLVKTTAAYHLPCRHVIHTVRPRVRGTRVTCTDLEQLALCYRRCLERASTVGDTSVVLPLLGTGSGGYPPRAAAGVVLNVIEEWLSHNDGVQIVLNTHNEAGTDAYLATLTTRCSARHQPQPGRRISMIT